MCFCFCQCIERCIYFWQTRQGGRRSVLDRLTAACRQAPEEAGLRKKCLEKEASLLYFEMNRGLWFLNFTSAVAPSLGLLGTVTGLISAFAKMAESSAVNIQDLSGGIWEAMLTTAFGMIISIPALLCYRTFKRIIEKRLLAMSLVDEDDGRGANHAAHSA
mgnify:CR=1 FL=1